MFSNGILTGALALLAGSQLAAAHMEVSFPPPFRSKFNPNANSGQIDYTNTAPLADSGANYPCKGYHKDVGTAAGASVATFAPGQKYSFTLAGSARHGGGSCQVSLSYDGGKTFTVIQSILGGCPNADSYPFTIPADAPKGQAIWAWTWNNNIGNREQYMNCAAVTIGAGGKRDVEEKRQEASAVGFSSRPKVFLANINNGCKTVEGTDVKYPNPGPDVINNGGKLGAPVGNCGASGADAGAGSGSGAGAGAGAGEGAGAAPSSSVQATTAAPAPTPAPTPGNGQELPGGVFITVDTSAAPATTTAAAATSTTVNAPAGTGNAGAGNGAGNGTGNTGGGAAPAGGHAQGTACTSDGAWNCIDGTSFQRCASGAWSAVQAVAPGTSCQAGESDTLSLGAASARPRRRLRSAKMRLSA